MPEDHVIREEDEDEDDIVLGDDGPEGDDDEFMNPLAEFLVTSDGENIADGIVGAIDRLSRQMDAQTKIFIKLYTVLTKFVPTPPTA